MADNQCCINAELIFKRNQNISACSCLPDCTAITYDVEISQAQVHYSAEDIELRGSLNESGYWTKLDLFFVLAWNVWNQELESISSSYRFEATSKLFISFKENHFIALNRSEAYTFADFVASCGGLLGLFMGISVLSVIELIYFFTLRLCCKLRKQHSAQTEASMWATRKNIAATRKRPFKQLYRS